MSACALISGLRIRFALWRVGRLVLACSDRLDGLAEETNRAARACEALQRTIEVFGAALRGDFGPYRDEQAAKWGPWIGLAVIAGTLLAAGAAAYFGGR